MTATVRKFLDLCTSHLPRRFWEDGHPTITGWYEHDVGALMWVPDDPLTEPERYEGALDDEDDGDEGALDDEDDEDDGDVAPEVLAIRVYARSLGCDYVLFDRDAGEDPALPTFTRG